MNDPVAEPVEGLTGPVHVVGAGLLGTSIGLALRAAGVEVWLSDTNHEHVRTATGLGAGRPAPDRPDAPAQLVVVACPPAYIADAVTDALEATPATTVVTDVGSVKALPLAEVTDRVDEPALARYVGSHPMAGSERSGPLAAAATLFAGRPWAVTPHVHAGPAAIALVEELARRCGAEPVRLSPVEHDNAVARTSHLPHLLAVLAATRLAEATPDHLVLSGQGVRDVTRVAAGDPELYGQIIRANQAAVSELLAEVRAELDEVIDALIGEAADDGEALEAVLARGVAGTQMIPGKHGGPPLETAEVYVSVPDTPGELARLLADVGEIGVNLEDLRIDHDPGRPVGLVELVVSAHAAEPLRAALEAREWASHR